MLLNVLLLILLVSEQKNEQICKLCFFSKTQRKEEKIRLAS